MTTTAKDIFSALIKSKSAPRIKLLGDSITHGVGGTGFAQNGEPIVDVFKRNPDGFCWANLFRDFMKERFGATVVNNACTGRNIEFIIQHFDSLVDADDDLVICNIGTNNRHQYFVHGPRRTKEEHSDRFYSFVVTLNAMFKKIGKPVIFIANIPAGKRCEEDSVDSWRIIHMNDINDIYKRAAEAEGFPLISMYDMLLEFCTEGGIDFETLLKDGLHPNDEGYEIMFRLMKQALGID